MCFNSSFLIIFSFLSVQTDKLTYIFREEEEIGWHDGQWLFPRAVQLLEIPTYRKCILNGLVLSIGSKTDGTVSLSASYSPISLLLT